MKAVNAPPRPGVYRMLDEAGNILYVGKARNLNNRLRSYFSTSRSPKVEQLMVRTRSIEHTITADEAAALILENELIKQHRPRYNVLFRDDKSYPYLRMDLRHPFPRLSFYRGKRHPGSRYFGPYPNTGALRKTLSLLQKLFKLRNCTDTFFKHRTRPCLQYQIQRCSAPCTERISQADYQQDLEHAIAFLQGRSAQVIEALVEPMQQAAAAREYERAAHYRDMIARLRQVQQEHSLPAAAAVVDVIACVIQDERACIQLFVMRGGVNVGNRAYFPAQVGGREEGELIAAFLGQHYLENQAIPAELLLSHPPADRHSMAQALSRRAGRQISLRIRGQGERRHWLELARTNASSALQLQQGRQEQEAQAFRQLAAALQLTEPPERIECFDVSHTGGAAATASCVVHTRKTGAVPAEYRRFNLRELPPGDDYAGLHQAVLRNYSKPRELPALLLIDGGRGQAAQATQALQELQLQIRVIGIAKDPTRKSGLETVYSNGQAVQLSNPALQLLLRVRDEAHRFALQGHRRRRQRLVSPLEGIPGIGTELRHRLLEYFGGLQGVRHAAATELARVQGVGPKRADRIHRQLHSGNAA